MHEPHIDAKPNIHASAYIAPSANVIGDVTIGKDASVWPQAVIRGDMNSIHIGDRSNVQDGAVLHITHKSKNNPAGHTLYIGDEVTIGHKACLHGCYIGNLVLIGIGAIVLDGARIADRVMIGAGTIVGPGKELESGYLYLGSPARKVRALSDKELEYFAYSAQNYVDLKDAFINKRPHFYSAEQMES